MRRVLFWSDCWSIGYLFVPQVQTFKNGSPLLSNRAWFQFIRFCFGFSSWTFPPVLMVSVWGLPHGLRLRRLRLYVLKDPRFAVKFSRLVGVTTQLQVETKTNTWKLLINNWIKIIVRLSFWRPISKEPTTPEDFLRWFYTRDITYECVKLLTSILGPSDKRAQEKNTLQRTHSFLIIIKQKYKSTT